MSVPNLKWIALFVQKGSQNFEIWSVETFIHFSFVSFTIVYVCFRRQLVAKQMARMPQFIKDHHAKKSKVAEQERLHEAKHHELMEEARDYFGYNIDPKDPRFEEMKLKKEEEEMKLAKKKKKEAKALRLIMGLSAPKSQ